MVKVLLAEKAGFCFGVKRAIEMLDRAVKNGIEKSKPVSMLGPIIHNPRLIEKYEKVGVCKKKIEEIKKNSMVIIRSHGVTVEEENYLKSLENVEITDTTCPFVKKIHHLVDEKSRSGYAIIVLGDECHSEVTGIISRIKNSYEGYIIVPPDDYGELKSFLKIHEKFYVVAQTTSLPESFEKLIAFLKNQIGSKTVEYSNTVCDATFLRQKAAKTLAEKVDVMIVIGGKNSSNTAKLFKIVSLINDKSIWIESLKDLDDQFINLIKSYETVGVTAGASTPDEQINEIVGFIEGL